MKNTKANKNVKAGVEFALSLVILTTACGQQRGNAEPADVGAESYKLACIFLMVQ